MRSADERRRLCMIWNWLSSIICATINKICNSCLYHLFLVPVTWLWKYKKKKNSYLKREFLQYKWHRKQASVLWLDITRLRKHFNGNFMQEKKDKSLMGIERTEKQHHHFSLNERFFYLREGIQKQDFVWVRDLCCLSLMRKTKQF